jgi:predicted aspartyl protease
MAGHLIPGPYGTSYRETLYDTAHGNQEVASILAACQPERVAVIAKSQQLAPQPQPLAPVFSQPAPAPPRPAPIASDGDSVPITVTDGATASVAVMLGSIAVTMLIDTGAAIGSVDPIIAQNLIAGGEGSDAGTINVILAGGRQVPMRRIVINHIQIGVHSANNVAMIVNDQSASMLLPFTLLSQMGRFNLDIANRRLAFGG